MKKCPYCNAKVMDKQKMCAECYKKLKLIRRLQSIARKICGKEDEGK